MHRTKGGWQGTNDPLTEEARLVVARHGERRLRWIRCGTSGTTSCTEVQAPFGAYIQRRRGGGVGRQQRGRRRKGRAQWNHLTGVKEGNSGGDTNNRRWPFYCSAREERGWDGLGVVHVPTSAQWAVSSVKATWSGACLDASVCAEVEGTAAQRWPHGRKVHDMRRNA